MWQKCPICNGTGKDHLSNNEYCPICNGKRIINELTGLPPKDNKFTELPKPELSSLSNLKNPK